MAIVYVHRIPKNKEIFYIGIGKSIKRAYQKSKYQRNPRWLNIVKKHGYEVEITHNDITWEEACIIEKYLISFWRQNSNYGICNITDGGEGTLGVKLSDETKRKIGEKNKIKLTGRKITNVETLKKISIKSKLRMTDELREQISKRMKNRVVSEETRKKISEKMKGRTNRKGYKLSEEQKRKISNSNLGRKGSNLGKEFSQEHKKKISDAQKGEKNHRFGKTNSPEHKEKVSISLKKYNQEKNAI